MARTVTASRGLRKKFIGNADAMRAYSRLDPTCRVKYPPQMNIRRNRRRSFVSFNALGKWQREHSKRVLLHVVLLLWGGKLSGRMLEELIKVVRKLPASKKIFWEDFVLPSPIDLFIIFVRALNFVRDAASETARLGYSSDGFIHPPPIISIPQIQANAPASV